MSISSKKALSLCLIIYLKIKYKRKKRNKKKENSNKNILKICLENAKKKTKVYFHIFVSIFSHELSFS